MNTDIELSCAICGSQRTSAVCMHPDFGVHQFRCHDCDQLQSVPPSDRFLSWYYAQTYREERNESLTPAYRTYMQARAQFQADYIYCVAQDHGLAVKPTRVLEIGAGSGAFLSLFDAEKVAIEPDEGFAQGLRETHPDIDIITWDELAAMGEPSQAFDLVLMSHVLEHLPDPVRQMRLIHDRLTPDGLLFIEVPHEPQRLVEYISTTAQRGIGHLFHFDAASLRRLVEVSLELTALDILTTGITIDEFMAGTAANPTIFRPVEDGSALRALVQRTRAEPWQVHDAAPTCTGADAEYYQRALYLQTQDLADKLGRVVELYEKCMLLSEYVMQNPPSANDPDP